ncbi:hypothetical protein C2E23DRAFT_887936 [Lenzites betulinus]|nr:hypothetical protein C2E23DRAFT_887936 [Lenzites betulinus]
MSGTPPSTISATTGSGRALYGPPALRIFTQMHDPQPGHTAIAQERFARRFNIRFDNDDRQDSGSRDLHQHFCTSSEDRGFAFQEAMGDIEDAAIGAARTADTLFLGFGIRPEWPPSRPLRAADIDVRVVATRQVEQSPAFKTALDKIRRIVQEEIAIPHIMAFHDKLTAFTPGAGYAFDAATRRIITQPIQLAADATRSSPIEPQVSSTGSSTATRSSIRTGPATTHNVVEDQQSPSRIVSTVPNQSRTPSQPRPQSPSSGRGVEAVRRGDSLAAGTEESEPSLLLRLAMELGIPTSPRASRAEIEAYYGFPGADEVPSASSTPNPQGPARLASRTVTARAVHREAANNNWIRTPSAAPPLSLPPSPASLPSVHADPPPPYTRAHETQDYSAHYTSATVESFGFSTVVRMFLEHIRADARQCAQVMLALDFHVADWEPLFHETAGLSRRDAHTLRRLIFREVSQQLRDLMEAARPLAESGEEDGNKEDDDSLGDLSSRFSETLSSVSMEEDGVWVE